MKVNIDEEQGLSMKYGVMSIPTMILFKDGEPAAAAVGAQPKSALERSLGFARAWRKPPSVCGTSLASRNLIGSCLQQVLFRGFPLPLP